MACLSYLDGLSNKCVQIYIYMFLKIWFSFLLPWCAIHMHTHLCVFWFNFSFHINHILFFIWFSMNQTNKQTNNTSNYNVNKKGLDMHLIPEIIRTVRKYASIVQVTWTTLQVYTKQHIVANILILISFTFTSTTIINFQLVGPRAIAKKQCLKKEKWARIFENKIMMMMMIRIRKCAAE